MSASFALLGFLQQSPNYGYELKKLYDAFFGRDRPILSGQVYATLGRLKRDAKIESMADDSISGGPERIKYAITTEGTEALETWLRTPEKPSPTLQTTLYVKTVLAVMKDGDAAEYLDNQRRAHIARMRQLTALRRTSNVGDMLLIDHAIYHLEADLRWIEMTCSRLAQLKEDLCHNQF